MKEECVSFCVIGDCPEHMTTTADSFISQHMVSGGLLYLRKYIVLVAMQVFSTRTLKIY
jgi:hypothetical protein